MEIQPFHLDIYKMKAGETMEQDEKKVWFWRKYCLILILLLFACITAYLPTKYRLSMVNQSIEDVEELEQEVAELREEAARLEAERKGAEE